jgi:hypothetical protein
MGSGLLLGDAHMAKWWMGLALAAVVAGQPNAALAQNAPAGPRVPPEPVPCAPSSLGGMVQGPITPQMAPPGPGPDLSISANSPGAFSCDDHVHGAECYASLGGIGLKRSSLGGGIVTFIDPGDGTDTGIRPIAHHDLNNSALNYNNLSPLMEWGVSASVGYAVDDGAIELSGFYIPQQAKSITAASIGKLDQNFINPPVGFEGDNGLWLQADKVKLIEDMSLISAELNYRYANRAIGCVEPLIGIRYMDVHELLGIFTGDDDLTVVDINGNPDPTRQALYRVSSHSHIIAPQIGAELEYPICSRIAFVAHVKGAWGANFYTQNIMLTRGDGLVGINVSTSHTQFSHLYDMGFYLDFYLLERFRVRAGYNLLWVVNIPEAKSQINFDLMNTNGQRADHGSMFFSGPLIEMQFLF